MPSSAITSLTHSAKLEQYDWLRRIEPHAEPNHIHVIPVRIPPFQFKSGSLLFSPPTTT